MNSKVETILKVLGFIEKYYNTAEFNYRFSDNDNVYEFYYNLYSKNFVLNIIIKSQVKTLGITTDYNEAIKILSTVFKHKLRQHKINNLLDD